MIWSWIYRNMSIHRFWISRVHLYFMRPEAEWNINAQEKFKIYGCELMVYLTTISMYYVLYKMGNSKSETESMQIKKFIENDYDVMFRCKPACVPPHCLLARTPLLSCAQWLFMHACTREDWPFTFILHRLNRAEITGICHGRGHILNYVMARRGVLTNQKPPLI